MADTATDVLNMPVREFVDAVAAKTPTPGGGSVAGLVGALGTALGEMTLNFTRGKKKYAEHAVLYERLGPRLAKARGIFADLIADDMAAYEMYREAAGRDDGPDKDEAMALATAAAINVPRETAKLALAVQADLLELAPRCNRYLVTDLIAGAELAACVCALCDLNVRVNCAQLDDAEAAAELRHASADDVNKARRLRDEIHAVTADMLG